MSQVDERTVRLRCQRERRVRAKREERSHSRAPAAKKKKITFSAAGQLQQQQRATPAASLHLLAAALKKTKYRQAQVDGKSKRKHNLKTIAGAPPPRRRQQEERQILADILWFVTESLWLFFLLAGHFSHLDGHNMNCFGRLTHPTRSFLQTANPVFSIISYGFSP